MDKKFQRTLFVFRRDLRLEDNTALIFALKHSKEVIPCFIFTPMQIESNPYFGQHSLQFLIECLEELNESLESKQTKLYLFYEEPQNIVEKCITKLNVDAVIVNRDYTPYSRKRDHKIQLLCEQKNVYFQSFDDALLHPPEKTLKSDETPYKVFTPFFKNAAKLEVESPTPNKYHNYYRDPISFSLTSSLYTKMLPKRTLPCMGGRSHALKTLKNLKNFSSYELLRDIPEKNATTKLSAHLKFTTCSPREVYFAILKQLGSDSDLIRSLYWRDFFTSITFYFPKVFKGAFYEKFNEIQWSQDKKAFQKWCDGNTGFPIVDAGMRELNQTGFMHNRVRMITASFLVKDLHIDWKWGERYFAQKLSDYDPAINNGNWQWVASTGCDAQPYFRIFNPWTQSLKFDPDALYIKKWIPELSNISPSLIHKWYLEKNYKECSSYPQPMVQHEIESKITIEAYKV